MLKILKNLKKSWLSVLIIVLLLCIEAWVDLELPNYTSKIVNVGIQQGGIENSYPEVIRADKMEELFNFIEEPQIIFDDYSLISKGFLNSEDYEKYLSKYPLLENEDLYIVNELSDDQKEKLNIVMAKALITDFSLKNKELLSNTAIQKDMSSVSDSMLEQASISIIKEEYKQVGMNTDDLQNSYILKSGLQMLAIAFLAMICDVGSMLLSSRVGAKLGKNLREKVFKKVLSFSTKEFREFSTASLITRSTNDIQQMQNITTLMFRIIVYAPIIGIGGFVKVITSQNTSMAWIIGLAISIIIAIVLVLFSIAMPKFKKLQDLIDRLNLVTREILSGMPVIRAFNTQKKEEGRFEKANKDLTKTNLFVSSAMSIMMPALMLVMNGITILIVWVGGKNVNLGTVQVGDMMAFIQYTIQIVISFLMISMISIILPRATVSANRINKVLETDSDIKEKDKNELKKFDENKKGLVEFKNVSFKYADSDEETLTDINFVAKPGQTTAIIGSTGSGKSTIVNLIPRFYDVTRGEILIDGVNIKDVSLKDLRKRIGFVPQKGVLFSGTIGSNIKYGNANLSDEDMIKAAKISQSEEFIKNKKEKYQTEISQGGNNVSGGQKQRLSIARAIAINPEILVFDDSFSALDLRTDKKLREALAKEENTKTVIVVAQRISTIMNAQQIIVLEEGKIVGIGTHKELLKKCDTYKQIAMSQLSEEELNK